MCKNPISIFLNFANVLICSLFIRSKPPGMFTVVVGGSDEIWVLLYL